MESPKFNLSRVKNFSPSKRDLNASDSFSKNPGLLSNNTPDYLKPKTSGKFSNKTEFTSSVQEFLKQSSEIQDEIRKLSEICSQISPKGLSNKTIEVPEKVDWEKVAEVIKTCGFKPLKIIDEDVDHESLIDTFLEVIFEYSSQYGIFEQTKAVLNKLENENDELIERNKFLEQKFERSQTRKNIEAEVRELEKISKNMENKFRKMKENLKEKEEIIKELTNGGKYEKKLEDVQFYSGVERIKEIFRVFIGRDFRDSSKTDAKIISLIETFEKHKDFDGPNELRVILDELEVETSNDALSAIAKLKQDFNYSAIIENFLQELYYQLFLRPLPSKYFSARNEEVFDEILTRVAENKEIISSLEEFKQELMSILQCKRNSATQEIVESVQAVAQFKRLFNVEEGQNQIQAIEEIFLFVHEIKKFLQRARIILGKESLSLNDLLEEIMQHLS